MNNERDQYEVQNDITYKKNRTTWWRRLIKIGGVKFVFFKERKTDKKIGKESRHKNENNERRKQWQLLEMVERADKD